MPYGWEGNHRSGITHMHSRTHTPFYAILNYVWDYLGEPAPERYNQEGKTSLDLLEQEIVSGVASAGPYANLHLDPDT